MVITTLAEFYGVSTDYLMGLSENKTIPWYSDLQSLQSDEMFFLTLSDCQPLLPASSSTRA